MHGVPVPYSNVHGVPGVYGVSVPYSNVHGVPVPYSPCEWSGTCVFGIFSSDGTITIVWPIQVPEIAVTLPGT